MDLSALQLRLVTGSYAVVKWARLLESQPGRRFFVRCYFLYKRLLEDSTRALLRAHPELIRRGHVIDVGANIGYTARVFAAALDPGFRVYAFEPEDLNFALLQVALEQMVRRGAVVAIQAAVGAADGAAALVKNESHPADHHVLTGSEAGPGSSTVTVPLRSIDSFVAQERLEGRISLIKIDVQGYEPAVCQGMERTLAANPGCSVMLEFMPEALSALGFDPEALLHWFTERGYTVQTIRRDGGLSPGAPRDLGPNAYVDLLLTHAGNN
jgi:FkbM family methyltransferase